MRKQQGSIVAGYFSTKQDHDFRVSVSPFVVLKGGMYWGILQCQACGVLIHFDRRWELFPVTCEACGAWQKQGL